MVDDVDVFFYFDVVVDIDVYVDINFVDICADVDN